MATRAPAEVVDLSQDNDDEHEEEGEWEFQGRVSTVIVGIRYYAGRVGVNEMVGFVREPNNPYDSNAVKVANMYGDQVGHLKRELVQQIAPMLDNGSLRIEGIMPGGSKSTYTLPVDVYAFAPAASATSALQQLRRRLAATGLGVHLEQMTLEEATAAAAGRGAAGATRAGGRGGARAAAPEAQHVSTAQVADFCGRLFEDLCASNGPWPLMAAGPEVASPLFEHQKQALAWMVQRENSSALPPFWRVSVVRDGRGGGGGRLLYVHGLSNYETEERPEPLRGGILGDDMGLGKTLQVLALIATNRPGAALPPPELPAAAAPAGAAAASAAAAEPGPSQEPQEPQAKRRKKDKAPATAGPAASPPGSSPLMKRAAASASKKREEEDQALLAQAELPPVPPAATGPRGTLIVCPLSVLSNWTTQLEEHTAGNLKVAVYHGPDRARSRAFLQEQDVVLTTYSTLSADLDLRANQGGLFSLEWLRVVLDEAHTIRNPKTRQSKACASLRASRRWCVTGTPLMNRVGDVHGLLVFLGLRPLDDTGFWRRAVERPLKQGSNAGLLAVKVLMGAIALRRTKSTPGPDGQPLVRLPRKTVSLVHVELGPKDRENYDKLEEETKRLVTHHLTANTLVSNFTSVLAIIMRLRQVCDSSTLCPGALEQLRAATAAAKQAGGPPPPELLAKLVAALAGDESEECSICLSPLELPCITLCGHVFCRRCIESVIVRDKPACPLCRAVISAAGLIDPPPPDQEGGDEPAAGVFSQEEDAIAGSAKIQTLLSKLREARAEGEAAAAAAAAAGAPAPLPVKSVVFSQFRGMLDLVGRALEAEGISFVRVDGTTSAKARADAISAFAEPGEDGPSVFLASLKAAGQGTNLTAATRVFLLDPWWTPAVEDQAMDRVHRLGQTRDVFVYRFVCNNTIETRMLEMQAAKAALARAAWNEAEQGGANEDGAGSSAAAALGGGRRGRQGSVMGVRAADLRRLVDL